MTDAGTKKGTPEPSANFADRMDDGPSLEDASNAIHALLNHYHDEVVPAFGRLDAPEKQVVQVALLVRSPPLVEAVLHLAEAGFDRETMMLTRPLFESRR